MKSNSDKSYEMELLFRALADRTRLRLINLMGEDEVCVCFLVEALKLTQPKISRHLAYLRGAGSVPIMMVSQVRPIGPTPSSAP